MPFAGSVLFFGFRPTIKIVARKRPRTHRDKVSCWKGSLGTYARKSSIVTSMNLKVTVGMSKKNTNKHKRSYEGLNGGAFRSSFRLRFVTILAHMMLEDDTNARPRTHTS